MFNPIDYQLLSLLQQDAHVTQSAMAASVGLSQPAVADRVKRLEERGAILGYTARVDPKLLGLDVRAFVGVRIAHPRHHQQFIKKILSLPEVLECHRVAGADSYVLKVMAEDTESLDRLLTDVLRRIPGVTRTHTTVVLAAVKETSNIPLPQPAEPVRRRKESR